MSQKQPESAPSYERAYKREKLARKQAEQLLERRSRELYEAKQRIEKQLGRLEKAHDDLKFAQAQLVQSEKMASVGQLAAGIAHEINNPVAFIASNLNSLGSYVGAFEKLIRAYAGLTEAVVSKDGKVARERLEEIEALKSEEDYDYLFEDVVEIISESRDGTERVVEIVQGLKNFSRLDENELKDASVNEGIESTLKIAWNELKYTCNVKTDLGELPAIRCYAGQLNQVFLNLLVNAAQATGEDGEVQIRTYRSGSAVNIEIKDNGCGIAQEHLDSIFNPFFTTKDVGEGTGLGLSISYAIVEKHGGDIKVESQVGVGTTFTITLPIEGLTEVAA